MEFYMPEESIKLIKEKIGKTGIITFISTFIVGLLTHMSILTSDIPNHDGLQSMYFDQNMITSGRFFLGTACGISSFYSVPWFIGLLSIIYISIAAVILSKTLKVKSTVLSCIMGTMLVTFPSTASNFAYVFTMDGYMLGLLLAILSVYFVDKYKFGFIIGGISLAFSMGIYQSYLPIAMLLSIYMVLLLLVSRDAVKEKIKKILNYLYMGVIGVSLYYILLQILLKMQGKTLANYQGIDGMDEKKGLLLIPTIKAMVSDFVKFIIGGKVLFSNIYTLIAVLLLLGAVIFSIFTFIKKENLFKNPLLYVLALLVIVVVPLVTNIILVISPDVTYHLLMRYQYVMFGIIGLAVVDRVGTRESLAPLLWLGVISGFVITYSYALTDNIAYSNLIKKYEKTYAYCLRLADRIEQTEGYEKDMPIYLIGVVGDENFPVTDITGDVTENMIGINGDFLVYRSENYADFFKYYLGITMNFAETGEYDFYYEDWYNEMPSFPQAGSTMVKDGILIVKTENQNR